MGTDDGNDRRSRPHLSLNKVISKHTSNKGYDHRVVKQRKFYEKAKTYNSFKRIRSHLEADTDGPDQDRLAQLEKETAAMEREEMEMLGIKEQPKTPKQKKAEAPGQKFMSKKEMKELAKKKAAEIEAKRLEREKKVELRRAMHKRMEKRTRRGQPVMKHRVEAVFHQLRREAKATKRQEAANATASI